MDVLEAIEGRRSIRAFDGRPVSSELLKELCAAGLRAPAPHHTQPWRFLILESPGSRERLADEMGQAWRADLEEDGVPAGKISALLEKSRRQITNAPGLVLCGIVGEGLRGWPDQRRLTFEWQMAAHSMGAALQNIMLAAHARGVATFWISAPLYAPEAVRAALGLSEAFVAQALIAFGYPAGDYAPRKRPNTTSEKFVSTV
jgi:F420 biosynthesis protein FbiB-like protein